jgi:hypothetical protein
MASFPTRPSIEQRGDTDFAIVMTFVKDSPDPARVFRSMSKLIAAFQRLDRELVRSVDTSLETVMLLEDIESGSIKGWLRSVVTSVDDTALKDGDWKKVVGAYLVKAKYLLIDFLGNTTEIVTKDELNKLQGSVLEAAASTGVKRIPAYTPPSRASLAQGMKDITGSLAELQTGDGAKFETTQGDVVEMRIEVKISPKSLDDLIIEESILNDEDLILKVKKPDFLGDSQWEFIHEHVFEAKVLDDEFLQQFRNSELVLRPGSAVRARVRVEVCYGYEGEVVQKKYQVLKVYEVIQPPEKNQGLLLE